MKLQLIILFENGLTENFKCHDFVIKDNGTLLLYDKKEHVIKAFAHGFWKDLTVGAW